jgi:predicted DNA binding CopG/RHH family protein
LNENKQFQAETVEFSSKNLQSIMELSSSDIRFTKRLVSAVNKNYKEGCVRANFY